MLSSELLEKALTEWGSLYRKKFSEPELLVWKRIFIGTDYRILGLALEHVTVNAERMPTPGHLTKAIAMMRDKHPEFIEKTGIYWVAGKDANGMACVFWSDEPVVPAYRAPDCAEGRAFLSTLRKMGYSPKKLTAAAK
jgi:hypothetical protein